MSVTVPVTLTLLCVVGLGIVWYEQSTRVLDEQGRTLSQMDYAVGR